MQRVRVDKQSPKRFVWSGLADSPICQAPFLRRCARTAFASGVHSTWDNTLHPKAASATGKEREKKRATAAEARSLVVPDDKRRSVWLSECEKKKEGGGGRERERRRGMTRKKDLVPFPATQSISAIKTRLWDKWNREREWESLRANEKGRRAFVVDYLAAFSFARLSTKLETMYAFRY